MSWILNTIGLWPTLVTKKITRELLERVIAKDRHAATEFVTMLTPVLMQQIGWVLMSWGNSAIFDVNDVLHDTFVKLLQQGGRVALSWNPNQASFETFAAGIARCMAKERLKRSQREVVLLKVIPEDETMAVDSRLPTDKLFESKEMFQKVVAILKAEETELACEMFDLLFIAQLDVSTVCSMKKMSEDAVHAWSSRLLRRVKEIATRVGDKK